jgi:serine/threonine-protein kinase
MAAREPDWERIKHVFALCVDATDAARAALLGDTTTCPPEVRAEVEALLAAHAAATPLDAGAAQFGAPLFADADALPERIGPYRPLSRLGAGGMGTVYLAERDEAGLVQRVALKQIRTGLDSPALRTRLARERAILARLTHDGIARLFDGGIAADGRPWFALELVDGEPITRYADRLALTPADRVRLVRGVLDAVAYAHRNLVVHRDVKPGNVLVGADGRPKLLDFGIAKLLDEDDATQTTTALTPAYAAPEQLDGGVISTATDIHALGLLLYELLVGRLPYAVDPARRVAYAEAVAHAEPERLRKALARTGEPDAATLATRRGLSVAALTRALDRDLDAIVERALAKRPEQRYASVDAFAADLDAWLAHRPLPGARASHWRRLAKYVRRHRIGVAASIAVAAALAVAAGIAWTQARQTERHARTALAVRQYMTGIFAAIDPEQARGRVIPLREVLDQGARRAEQGLSDQPGLRGALLSDFGAIYASLGDGTRAIGLLEAARASLADDPDSDRAERARAAIRLAAALEEAGRYDDALTAIDAALALLGDRPYSDALRAEAEIQRGRIDVDLDRLDEASIRLTNVADFVRPNPDASMQTRINAFAALGWLRTNQSRHEDAEPLLREALALQRELDPDSPSVASRLHELAGAVGAAANAPGAVPLLREALALHEKHYGPRHPLTLSSEGELALWLAEAHEMAEAEVLYQRNLAARREVFGETSDDVAVVANNYALLLYGQRRYADAAPLFGQAWRIWRTDLGAEHVRTRTAMGNYAAALGEIGRDDEAEPLLREALALSDRLNPPRRRGSPRNSLALMLERTGRLDEAATLMRAGIDADIAAFDGDEAHYTWSRTIFGRVLRKQGDLAGAREQLEKALAAYDADAYPDGLRTATCLAELARVRIAQHQPDGAAALVDRALVVYDRELGADHAETRAARELRQKLQ